jgi:hypothetical protein
VGFVVLVRILDETCLLLAFLLISALAFLEFLRYEFAVSL